MRFFYRPTGLFCKVLACGITLLSAASCTSNKTTKKEHLSAVSLCVGDIVFRRGTGLASRAVLTVDKSGVYSHVGIIVHSGEGWGVVHAVPGESDGVDKVDRVKLESFSSFFEPEKAVAGAVMRVGVDSVLRSKAACLAIKLYERHVPFDHFYDSEDTLAMYCSELVEFVYLKAGVDLVEGRYSEITIPGLSGCYLLPSDIQSSRYLNLVEQF